MEAYSVKMSEQFVKNLDILHKTMTQISEADRKGKYAKSFQKLIESIRKEMLDIAENYLFTPMILYRNLTDSELKELQSIYDSCNEKLKTAVFEEHSPNNFYGALQETQSDLNVWFVMHDCAFDAEYEINYATGEGVEL